MKSFYSFFCGGLLVLLLVTGGRPAAAQAPAWQSARAVAAATVAGTNDYSQVTATAVDAAGNVYLAGFFENTVVLGGTTLISAGRADIFVTKFDPVSNQFVWVQRAGGAFSDIPSALAVSGTNIYVAGSFMSLTVGFGPATVTNAGNNAVDMFVTKLTDTGSFVWAQRAGGMHADYATALTVSGTSVYMAGGFASPTVDFGTTTLTTAGLTDVFVAKLTDAGSTGSFVWAQRAGGRGEDVAHALAVSGTSVYVAGAFNRFTATFGATTLTNSGFADVFVAKLTDAGNTGSFAWAQRAGGMDNDQATALAVSGTSVYVAGHFASPTVGFGTTVLTIVGIMDVFVAKLTDMGSTGSFAWVQQAGGMATEATALAVSGPSIYVAGRFIVTASFGSTTLIYTRSDYDLFVAKVADAGSTGSFVWAQGAGGPGSVRATALAVSSTSVYVAGSFTRTSVSFGTITVPNPNPNPNSGFPLGLLASLTDATLTATTAAPPREPLTLFPNPAQHTATLRLPAGTPPAPLTLTDAQGRTVRRYPAPAGPTATLDLRGLPAGLYLLGGAGPTQRLLVE